MAANLLFTTAVAPGTPSAWANTFHVLSKIVSERFSSNPLQAKKALMRWMLEVIYQESKVANVAQSQGGPGRGFFQYELEKGGSGANKVTSAVDLS